MRRYCCNHGFRFFIHGCVRERTWKSPPFGSHTIFWWWRHFLLMLHGYILGRSVICLECVSIVYITDIISIFVARVEAVMLSLGQRMDSWCHLQKVACPAVSNGNPCMMHSNLKLWLLTKPLHTFQRLIYYVLLFFVCLHVISMKMELRSLLLVQSTGFIFFRQTPTTSRTK